MACKSSRSNSRAAKVCLALVVVVAAGLFAPTAAAIEGQLRVLYVLMTWGPMPFGRADAERVAAETDAFFRASSFGRLSMPGDVAVWDQAWEWPPELCDIDPHIYRVSAPPSLLDGYDRVVFVSPKVDACEFRGVAEPFGGTAALLNGELNRYLAVHELGHTLGLAHARSWACVEGGCGDEYGNPFTAMGNGDGDFNAYEKSRLGWLSGNGIVRPRRSGTHELGSIEGQTRLPQALVVTTAAGDFWFESRGTATPAETGDSVQPPGIAVLAGPGPGGESPYSGDHVLLANPNGGARYAYSTGESFVRPGVFRVTVERQGPEHAELRFEWLDRLAPGRPRLRVRAAGKGHILSTWGAGT